MIRLVLAAAIALALSQPADARRLPWCGFYMMHLKHKTDRRLALARMGARRHGRERTRRRRRGRLAPPRRRDPRRPERERAVACPFRQ
jgi:hypothetical protein